MASLLNRNINTDNMYCFKTSTVRFLSKEEVAWTLDGEFGGKHREVVISNQREALHIIVPEKLHENPVVVCNLKIICYNRAVRKYTL